MGDAELLAPLRRAAAQSAEKPALGQGALRFSRAQLLEAIELMAGRLRSIGVGPGCTIAALAENRPEIMLTYYAAARLRAVFVPINPVLSAGEMAHVVRHSGAAVLVHESGLQDAAAEAMEDPARRWSFERLAQMQPVPVGEAASSHPGEAFLVIYTSGSTGVPKAVVFDQAAELAGNASLIEMWGIGPADITLVALPLGFLYGLSTAAATGLQAGGQVMLLRKFHPREVLKSLVEARVTIFHGVPTMFAMMLNFAESEDLQIDLSGVRLLICAGAPLAQELRERFERRFRKRIDDYYALTEARPVFGRRFDDVQFPPPGAIGRAAPGVQVHILGEGGRELGPREHGELVLRAPGMFLHYAQAPELTAQVLGPLGFRTGDIGYYDEHGNYYLTGRIKDIIIRGGANIAPAEVEGVLAAHPTVEMAAVVGVPDPIFGEVPRAFVTLRQGSIAGPEELLQHCSERLAAFKVPTRIEILGSLPLGSTGKIDKATLRARARSSGS